MASNSLTIKLLPILLHSFHRPDPSLEPFFTVHVILSLTDVNCLILDCVLASSSPQTGLSIGERPLLLEKVGTRGRQMAIAPEGLCEDLLRLDMNLPSHVRTLGLVVIQALRQVSGYRGMQCVTSEVSSGERAKP